jgi:putative ABC transport system substrate-binding protein
MNRRAFVAGLGAVLAAPCGAEAQAGKAVRIGYLSPGNKVSPDYPYLLAIRDGLRDEGYVVGRDVFLDWQFADNDYARLPELAAALVRSGVQVFLCATTPACRAAKNATKSIPIVMLSVGDPVGFGFVDSLGHPGGNMTGLSINVVDAVPKRLQLIKEIAPQSSRIGILFRRGNPTAPPLIKAFEAAATPLHLVFYVVDVNTADDLDAAFAAFTRSRVGAVVVLRDPLLWDNRTRLGQMAIKAGLLTLTDDREFVDAHLLMSYGPDDVAYWRRSGFFIAKILKGAKPADIPVEQPTKYELVINLKTAKALGLTIPPSLLLRADQIIE